MDPSGALHVIHNPSCKSSAPPAPQTKSPTHDKDDSGQIASEWKMCMYRWDPLHFWKKNIWVRVCLLLCSSSLKSAWLCSWAPAPAHSESWAAALLTANRTHVEQFYQKNYGEMQIYLPTYKSPQQRGGKKNGKRGQRGCEARWTTEINVPPADWLLVCS